MGLGFLLLSAQVRLGETHWTRAYHETLRLAVEAERLGSDLDASASRPPPSPPPFRGPNEALLKLRTTYAGTPYQLVEILQDMRRQAELYVGFVARSYFPLVGVEEHVDRVKQLEEGIAPHV